MSRSVRLRRMSKEALLRYIPLFLLLFCAACGTSSGQPLAIQDRATADERSTLETRSEDLSCGRQNYPVYQDVENQMIVERDIKSGSAQVILHFHELGQATLDQFLDRTKGVLIVDSQWPDWGAISITVNEASLTTISQDCAVRVIEANKREIPQ